MTTFSPSCESGPARPLALIFDLDGTLVHSLPGLAEALNALLAEHGRPPVTEDTVMQMVGDGAQVLVRRAWAHTGAAAADEDLDGLTDRFVSIYEGAAAAGTQPYPGVLATLGELGRRGHPMAVCTNKPHGATMVLLEALDMARHFRAVIGGGSVPGRKPGPEPVLAALEALGVGPEEALMIGDGANDVEAARAAGVATACVTYGYPHQPVETLGAGALIDRFEQVLDLVAARALPKA